MAKKQKKAEDFASKVREFFGMPQPGQKKLTPKEMERQIKAGRIKRKADE